MGLTQVFSDIADAIREKSGSSDTYLPTEMAQAIEDIPSGGTDPTIEQGETTKTYTDTASVTAGAYYLFSTVYGAAGFTSAKIVAGSTEPIYTASGIGRTGCIIRADSDTVGYNRYGEASANEYTELDVIDGEGVAELSSTWNSGASITAQSGKKYLLALGDGETGNITGAEVLVETELVDTVSNGTRFLIVKATGSSVSLSSGNSFYYLPIGILV